MSNNLQNSTSRENSRYTVSTIYVTFKKAKGAPISYMSICKPFEGDISPSIAIHCKDVGKSFFEPMKGSRSWGNLFLGRRKKVSAVQGVSFDVHRR